MPRIRTREDRRQAERERVAEVARVLMESAPVRIVIALHVADNGQLPRIPVIGFEAGAIRGTIPHRSRLLWRARA